MSWPRDASTFALPTEGRIRSSTRCSMVSAPGRSTAPCAAPWTAPPNTVKAPPASAPSAVVSINPVTRSPMAQDTIACVTPSPWVR
jgi:hypothetical protein